VNEIQGITGRTELSVNNFPCAKTKRKRGKSRETESGLRVERIRGGRGAVSAVRPRVCSPFKFGSAAAASCFEILEQELEALEEGKRTGKWPLEGTRGIILKSPSAEPRTGLGRRSAELEGEKKRKKKLQLQAGRRSTCGQRGKGEGDEGEQEAGHGEQEGNWKQSPRIFAVQLEGGAVPNWARECHKLGQLRPDGFVLAKKGSPD
jgi:hypothetical protein